MAQIKSIKGIVGKLNWELQPPDPNKIPLWEHVRLTLNKIRNKIYDTDLDPNECACIDDEKLCQAVQDFYMKKYGFCGLSVEDTNGIAESIATSNCLKWREE